MVADVSRSASTSEGVTPSPEAVLVNLPDHPHATLGMMAGWGAGLLVLAGLVTFILHFGDFETFLTTLRRADPLWLAAAALCQLATYGCAAGVWWCVLRRTGAARPLTSLLSLALVELFANQALPSGGVSGSIMVIRGLVRRGVGSPTAITALLVAGLSYYTAYLLAGLSAFVLLWHFGDLSGAWLSLSIAFVAVVVLLAGAVLAVTRSRGRFIPHAVLRWQPAIRFSALLRQVRLDTIRDGRVVFEAVVFQCAVFLLDAATLWCAGHAVGLALSPASAFMSFVLASVVATLSPIPLGLGTFEGTCVGMLHLLGGGLETSLAATLILRGFTLWLPMLPGLWLIRREMKAMPTGATSPQGTAQA